MKDDNDYVGMAIAEDAAEKAAAGVRRWQVVPVEPTEEMIRAGQDQEWTPDVYTAMLAAAPQPPALGGEPEDLHLNPCKSCQGKFGGLKTYENALGKFHYVQCGSCEARTLGSTEITDVVAAWNKSSAEDQPVPVRMDIQIQRWDPDLLEATKLYFGRNEAHNFQIYLSGEFSRSKNKAQQPITVAGFRVTSPQTGKSKFYLPQKARLMPSFANCGYHITELIDHAHLAPLQAEIASERELRRELGVRVHQLKDELKDVKVAFDNACIEGDQLKARNAELESALKFYAEREHYHFESGNWHTVSGEPLNILWCGDEPDFIEDGSVARNALSKPAGSEKA